MLLAFLPILVCVKLLCEPICAQDRTQQLKHGSMEILLEVHQKRNQTTWKWIKAGDTFLKRGRRSQHQVKNMLIYACRFPLKWHNDNEVQDLGQAQWPLKLAKEVCWVVYGSMGQWITSQIGNVCLDLVSQSRTCNNAPDGSCIHWQRQNFW